jgi:zinc and cadmium transporter
LHLLLWILSFVLIVSLISFVGVFTLFIKKKLLDKILFALIAFAAGTLLGAAFIHMLPEVFEENHGAFVFVLVGIILFLIIEKFIYWRHCHKTSCKIHSFTYMNLIGDAAHNFLDGVIMATAFLISIPLGIVVSLAVIFHEIPQEIGDFGILVYGGIKRTRALLLNFLVALTAFAGAILAYYLVAWTGGIVPYLTAISAGGFIYIGAVDLLPEIHKETNKRRSLMQLLAFIIGVIIIYVLMNLIAAH